MNYALHAQGLTDWLNLRGKSQNTVAAYIRWRNAGRSGHCPRAAHRLLFTRPLKTRLRDVRGLNLTAFANSDYGILRLVDVDGAGLMSRVRECPQCSNWFFAKNSKRKFCSPNCQVKHWQKTVEGRAGKAAYMRRYRATQKRLWAAKAQGRKLKRGRRKA